jgi:hypothetical protein
LVAPLAGRLLVGSGDFLATFDGDFWPASHDKTIHMEKEYVRREGEKVITTNTVEGYFSLFKRGMKGVHQHCSEKHLYCYLAEFDFRYSHRARLAWTTKIAPHCSRKASRASAWPIDGLTAPTYRSKAKRLLRWRGKNWKPPKRKVKRIWVR